MSQNLNPIRDALNVIRNRMVRTFPCAHGNIDTRLGNGEVWAKCEDCGQTVLQENLGKAKERAEEHQKAIERLDELHDLVQEAWVIAQKQAPGTGTPELAKTHGAAFRDTLVAKLLFESKKAANTYIDENLIQRMPDIREHYEVVPAYVLIP